MDQKDPRFFPHHSFRGDPSPTTLPARPWHRSDVEAGPPHGGSVNDRDSRPGVPLGARNGCVRYGAHTPGRQLETPIASGSDAGRRVGRVRKYDSGALRPPSCPPGLFGGTDRLTRAGCLTNAGGCTTEWRVRRRIPLKHREAKGPGTPHSSTWARRETRGPALRMLRNLRRCQMWIASGPGDDQSAVRYPDKTERYQTKPRPSPPSPRVPWERCRLRRLAARHVD